MTSASKDCRDSRQKFLKEFGRLAAQFQPEEAQFYLVDSSIKSSNVVEALKRFGSDGESCIEVVWWSGHPRHAALPESRLPPLSDLREAIALAGRATGTLMNALAAGRTSKVPKLLREGAQIDVLNGGESTLLSFAYAGDAEQGIASINYGANVRFRGKNARTALHLAAYAGCDALVEALLEHGALATAVTDTGQTTLHFAILGLNDANRLDHGLVRRDHLRVVQLLLSAGVDVDIQDDATALAAIHSASLGLCLPVVSLLVAHGADVAVQNVDGETPLLLALDASSFRVQWSKLRLKINATRPRSGTQDSFAAWNVSTFLYQASEGSIVDSPHDLVHAAIESIATPLVELLLRAAPHTGNIADVYNRTPLHRAARSGLATTVDALLGAGAGANVLDLWQQTPLHTACVRGEQPIVEMLVKAGADINALDSYKRTALHHAVIGGHTDVAAFLLGVKAKTNLKDKSRKTAREYTVVNSPMWALFHPEHSIAASATMVSNLGSLSAETVSEALGGGWDTNLVSEFDQQECDIEIRNASDVTMSEFLSSYFAPGWPVLLRGGVVGLSKLQRTFSRQNLERKFGGVSVDVGSIPYPRDFGVDDASHNQQLRKFTKKKVGKKQAVGDGSQTSESVLLRDFLRQPTIAKDRSALYIFDKNIAGKAPDLMPQSLFTVFDGDRLGDHRLTVERDSEQLAIGPALTGSPIHFHMDAFNALIFGRKRWFLYPPSQAFYSKEHPLSWLNRTQAAGALQCVQAPGDVLFVPNEWGHGVLNVAQSVAIAWEVNYPH